jgi:hypothetical protein
MSGEDIRSPVDRNVELLVPVLRHGYGEPFAVLLLDKKVVELVDETSPHPW